MTGLAYSCHAESAYLLALCTAVGLLLSLGAIALSFRASRLALPAALLGFLGGCSALAYGAIMMATWYAPRPSTGIPNADAWANTPAARENDRTFGRECFYTSTEYALLPLATGAIVAVLELRRRRRTPRAS